MDTFAELKELVRIVSDRIPERSPYLSRSEIKEGKTKHARFFRALIEDSSTSESTLAHKVFGVSVDDPSYKMEKSRFRQILMNTAFVFDLEKAKVSEPAQIEYMVRQSAFLARTFYQRDSDAIAKNIITEVLEVALKYELWHDAMSMLCCLRNIVTYEGEVEELKKLAVEYERIAAIEIAQQRSLAHFGELVAPFVRSGVERPDLASTAEEYLRQAEDDYNRYQTYGLAANVFRLRTAYYQVQMMYKETLAACDEYEALLLGRFEIFSRPTILGEVRQKRVLCNLHLGRYEEGLAAAEAGKEVIKKGSDNWFYLRQYEFLCYSNAIRFDDAQKVIEEVRRHERFSLQDEHLQERWKLYKMYMDYLRGTISTVVQSRDARAILKAIPLHKNDKAGLNALVYLLHMLLLLERTDKSEAINHMDAFRKYRSRYLDAKKFPAMAVFFKLLIMLEPVEFDPVRAEAKEQVILKELHAAKEDVSAGLQVVPYEWLWRKILAHLKLHPMV